MRLAVIAVLVSTIAVVPKVAIADTGVAEAIREGQARLYEADFKEAARVFDRAMREFPVEPAPAAFRALTALWQVLYGGSTGDLFREARTFGQESISRADRLPDQTASLFWRAIGESLQGVSDAGLSVNRSLVGLIQAVLIRSQIQRAVQELGRVSNGPEHSFDAEGVQLVFGPCLTSSPAAASCVDPLWEGVTEAQWFATEFKYFIIERAFQSRNLDVLRSRGIPLAIELHLRFAGNALFHLALVKLNYDAGNLEEARQYGLDLLQKPPALARSFVDEAKYYVGLVELRQSNCATAIARFKEVLKSKPLSPAYLQPWTLFRLSQCYVAVGDKASARMRAREVLAAENVNDVHRAARILLGQIDRR